MNREFHVEAVAITIRRPRPATAGAFDWMLDVGVTARQALPVSNSDTEESEAPRKVVGRRRVPNLLDPTRDTRAAAVAWRKTFPTPFVPKGVYRFSSQEEAQEWLTRMLTRRR
jgi:hypothetical protein